MAVGELFLSAFLQVLFDRLGSHELLNFVCREGLRKKLDRWSETLKGIEAVLADADEKQHTESAVKKWLDDLRDLTYDLEDILDEFFAEAMRLRCTCKDHRCLLKCPSNHVERGGLRILSFSSLIGILLVITDLTNHWDPPKIGEEVEGIILTLYPQEQADPDYIKRCHRTTYDMELAILMWW